MPAARKSDAIAVAIKMEIEGQRFYREAAAETRNNGLKHLFLGLALDEERHERVFRNLGKSSGLAPEKEIKGRALLQEMQAVFDRLRRSAVTAARANASQLEAMDIALGLEEKAYFTYRDAAEKTKSAMEKDVLLKISEEENAHFRLLSDTRFFVSHPLMYQAMYEDSFETPELLLPPPVQPLMSKPAKKRD